MEEQKNDIAELIAQLEELNQMLLSYNQQMANDPKRSKKLPSKGKPLSAKKMAFINKVYEIVLENPASALGAIDPGKFIQDVRNLKELTHIMEDVKQLQHTLEDKAAEQDGTTTGTTTGTASGV